MERISNRFLLRGQLAKVRLAVGVCEGPVYSLRIPISIGKNTRICLTVEF